MKLRSRGLRILEEATGASPLLAKRALDQSGSVRTALIMLKTGMSAAEARHKLQQTGGNLWQALARQQNSPRGSAKSSAAARLGSRKKA